MKAATYVSAGNLQLLDQPKPVIKNQRILACLEDNHLWTDPAILGGCASLKKASSILGHEGIGIVEEVGDAVNNFKRRRQGHHLFVSCL